MQCVHKEPVVCVKVIYLGRLLGGCHGFDVRLSFCVVVVITNFLGENTSSLTKSTGTSVRIRIASVWALSISTHSLRYIGIGRTL